MEKIITTMIGTFFGFLLGIVSLGVKERLDSSRRTELFKIFAVYLATSLKTYLHEDPSQCGGVDIKALNAYLDGAFNSKVLRSAYEELFTVYMDWSRGFYSANGMKMLMVNSTKSTLDELIITIKSAI